MRTQRVDKVALLQVLPEPWQWWRGRAVEQDCRVQGFPSCTMYSTTLSLKPVTTNIKQTRSAENDPSKNDQPVVLSKLVIPLCVAGTTAV